MSTSPRDPIPPGGAGVIHDLGYRPYEGPRLGTGAIATALFLTGLRHVFGLGRSGKSKVLPWVLLALNLLPALIMVGILVMVPIGRLPVSYAGYANTTQILVAIFVAAQAPVLFSHDQRHGSIVLYLARPLGAAAYALVRWASLWVAVLLYLVTPILLLYAGAVLSELPVGEQTADALRAVLLVAILAAVLAGVAGVIASWSTRRGFAVVATIMVLLVGDGVVAIIQGIASEQSVSRVGELAGLLSPYSLYRGSLELFGFSGGSPTPPTGLLELGYVGVELLIVAASLALLVARFRKVGAR